MLPVVINPHYVGGTKWSPVAAAYRFWYFWYFWYIRYIWFIWYIWFIGYIWFIWYIYYISFISFIRFIYFIWFICYIFLCNERNINTIKFRLKNISRFITHTFVHKLYTVYWINRLTNYRLSTKSIATVYQRLGRSRFISTPLSTLRHTGPGWQHLFLKCNLTYEDNCKFYNQFRNNN